MRGLFAILLGVLIGTTAPALVTSLAGCCGSLDFELQPGTYKLGKNTNDAGSSDSNYQIVISEDYRTIVETFLRNGKTYIIRYSSNGRSVTG